VINYLAILNHKPAVQINVLMPEIPIANISFIFSILGRKYDVKPQILHHIPINNTEANRFRPNFYPLLEKLH
jgi:hypothetical protein